MKLGPASFMTPLRENRLSTSRSHRQTYTKQALTEMFKRLFSALSLNTSVEKNIYRLTYNHNLMGHRRLHI